MADGQDQQYDATQLDTVQHPTLGELKFPKDMPFEERNQHIEKMLSGSTASLPGAQPRLTEAVRSGRVKAQPETSFEKAREPQSSIPAALPMGGTIDVAAIGRGAKQGWEATKGLVGSLLESPTNAAEAGIAGGKLGAQIGQEDVQRQEEGRSKPYRAAAIAGTAIGVPARQMEEQADIGQPEGVIGAAAPIAAATIAPSVIGRKAPGAIKEGARTLEERSLAKATKETKSAAPPARQEIDYNRALEQARPYLAEEQRATPVKSVREAHDAANAAIKNIESKVTAYVTSMPEEVTVSGPEILDAARERLRNPDTPRTPEEIQAGMRELEGFGLDRDMPIRAADRLRYRFNQDLESEMGMTEADRAAVRASNPRFAAKEAAVDALRDGVYDKLEENGVPGVRQIRQDQGKVIQMRDAFRRNITRSEKENAPSSFRRLGVFGPVGLGFLGETVASRLGLPPGVSAATGIGTAGLYEYLRNRMTPNPTISRAFRRFGASSERPAFPEIEPRAAGAPQLPPETPRQSIGGEISPREAEVQPLGMREQHGPLFANQGIGEPIRGEPESDIEMDIRRGNAGPAKPMAEEIREAEEQTASEEEARRQASEEQRPEAEEPEPVETKVKGITAEEPKTKAKRETLPPVEKLYSPEEITDAEGLINSEVGAMQSGGRPGRYFDESTEGEHVLTQNQRIGIDRAGGSWRGLKSGRDMYPFMREHPDWGPGQLEKALRNKDSALYKKAIGAAVDFIRREQEAERAAIQAESEASIAGEPIFPGMGREVAQQQRGAAQVRGEELTRRMSEPQSIEARAGEMETKSPLFRGTAASPQNEMFGQPIETEEEALAKTKRKAKNRE